MKDLKTITPDEAGKLFDCYTVEGTRAHSAWYAARFEILYTPVEPGSTSYFVEVHSGEELFNVKPFLKALHLHEPDEVIREIDRVLSDLSEYYLNDDSKIPNAAYTIQVVRTLRNALLSGMGHFTFDEHLEKEEDRHLKQTA